MSTIRNILSHAEKQALAANKEATAVKLLMQHITEKESYELLANFDEQLTAEQLTKFNELLTQYIEFGRPIQHLIGYETFFGYPFIVNEHVLIPRFETEELVAKVLELYDMHFQDKQVDVVDIGCGSGAIGITLALEEPNMNVTLTDISESALDVAQQNAMKLNASVSFLKSDMLDVLIEQGLRFDLLISNPPYIPAEEAVDALVYDHEPHLALFGGSDGLYFYRRILEKAQLILKPTAIIAFEHAYHHREGLAKLIGEFIPTAVFETLKDMQGRDRITVIKLSG